MKYKVYTNGAGNAPKINIVVANSAIAARIAVEQTYETTKVTKVEVDK